MTETTESTLPAAGTFSITDARVVRAIELVWREAALLDAKEYHAWEALYAEDGRYVIPIERDAQNFDDVLNMVYDDAKMRSARVVRMTEGYSMAAVDAATTVRTVSRFIPLAVSDDEVTMRAGQILVAFKRGHHHLWAADVDYTVRLGTDSGQDRLMSKVVRLVDADAAVPAAGFLL